jgi:hypothetical protein
VRREERVFGETRTRQSGSPPRGSGEVLVKTVPSSASGVEADG